MLRDSSCTLSGRATAHAAGQPCSEVSGTMLAEVLVALLTGSAGFLIAGGFVR
jgi:hypothetical protein